MYVPAKLKKVKVPTLKQKPSASQSSKRRQTHLPKTGMVKATCQKEIAKKPATAAKLRRDLCGSPMKLRLGSDCTGYNAASIAMESLRVQHTNVFASDINRDVRAVLSANFDIHQVFEDCTSHDAPPVDIYTAGFPCQPYSNQGRNKGKNDRRGSPIVKSIIAYIRTKLPAAFVLENVTGLVQQHRRWFDQIISELETISNSKGTVYKVYWEILDSKEFGLAQSRRRVIIVGLKKAKMMNEFSWPNIVPMKPLASFLEPRPRKVELSIPKNSTTKMSNFIKCLEAIKEKGGKLATESSPWVADLGPSKGRGPLLTLGYFPCITAARAGGENYYLFHRGRLRL